MQQPTGGSIGTPELTNVIEVTSYYVRTVYPFGTHEFISVSLCDVRVAQSRFIDFLFSIVFTSFDHLFGICKLFVYPIVIKLGAITAMKVPSDVS
jgi:hypothetical protein